jgi:hypothetical protein
MNSIAIRLLVFSSVLWGGVFCGSALGEDVSGGGSTAPPATEAASGQAQRPQAGASQQAPGGAAAAPAPTAEQVQDDLFNQLQENPLIEPTRPVADTAAAPLPIKTIGVDKDILSLVGGEMPALRREGEFIVNRKGHLVRAAHGGHVIFVFDADSEHAPDPPMVVVPCQMMQNMEDLVQERGDTLTFILSGQVLTYRGVNYLLPTMMKLAIDQKNLLKQ